MARPKKPKPDYCRDKSSGRAFFTIDRKRKYLGAHGTQAAMITITSLAHGSPPVASQCRRSRSKGRVSPSPRCAPRSSPTPRATACIILMDVSSVDVREFVGEQQGLRVLLP